MTFAPSSVTSISGSNSLGPSSKHHMLFNTPFSSVCKKLAQEHSPEVMVVESLSYLYLGTASFFLYNQQVTFLETTNLMSVK